MDEKKPKKRPKTRAERLAEIRSPCSVPKDLITADLSRELVVIIEELRKKRGELAEISAKRRRKEIRRTWGEIELAQKEAPIVKAVCTETEVSPTGREVLKYSNETLRKAEIEDRLAKDLGTKKDPGVGRLMKTLSLSNKLWIVTLRADESELAAEVQRLETMERLLLAELEKE